MMMLFPKTSLRLLAAAAAAAVVLFAPSVLAATTKPPHIFFILVDDLGWGDVGFNLRMNNNPEVMTPNMDELVQNGIHLTRHYVHNTCSQTRTSLQSGRLPVHVNLANVEAGIAHAGMHKNMTCFAEILLNEFNYKTHFVGKWDVGMTTSKHIPTGRGYQTSLGYFEHANNFWDKSVGGFCEEHSTQTFTDLWDTDGPAEKTPDTKFEEFVFEDRMKSIIHHHNPSSDPLLLFYAPHVAHCPLQVPERYLNKFDFIEHDGSCSDYNYEYIIEPGKKQPDQRYCRKQYRAQVNLLDDIIGNIVQALKEKNMYDDTLIVFTSDNGGQTGSGATNFPLRGGKFSPWEGGIRAAAFVSGGYLPQHVRGTTNNEMIHVADWYSTLVAFAHGTVGEHDIDEYVHDQLAEDSGLPPIDSINMKPLLMGITSSSPRHEIPIDEHSLLVHSHKLIWSKDVAPKTHCGDDGWTGPNHPYRGEQRNLGQGITCTHGCLFDVVDDPSERHDISSSHPDIVQSMKDRLTELKKNFYNNDFKGVDSCPDDIDMPCSCWMAINYYGGYLGPWQDFNITDTK